MHLTNDLFLQVCLPELWKCLPVNFLGAAFNADSNIANTREEFNEPSVMLSLSLTWSASDVSLNILLSTVSFFSGDRVNNASAAAIRVLGSIDLSERIFTSDGSSADNFKSAAILEACIRR